MQNTNPSLHPEAVKTLTRWHQMLADQDFSALPELLHPEALFRSPVAHKPYPGAQAVHLILSTVIQVFKDFTYHRELVSEDGLSVVLEFSAVVDDKALKGIDLIRFDEQGKIVEFEVMVRPLSGLQALGAEMRSRLEAFLPR